jgi:hypothetical protein
MIMEATYKIEKGQQGQSWVAQVLRAVLYGTALV